MNDDFFSLILYPLWKEMFTFISISLCFNNFSPQPILEPEVPDLLTIILFRTFEVFYPFLSLTRFGD